MREVTSFDVDHTKLKKGIYISRIDGDVVTYDIRMCIPNAGHYLSTPVIHTLEHLLATSMRSGKYGGSVVYVGPMGCRTGFYLLTRDVLSRMDVLELTCEAFRFVAQFSGKIPGSEERECGNYREHDLPGAQEAALEMCAVLKNYTPARMDYEENQT